MPEYAHVRTRQGVLVTVQLQDSTRLRWGKEAASVRGKSRTHWSELVALEMYQCAVSGSDTEPHTFLCLCLQVRQARETP